MAAIRRLLEGAVEGAGGIVVVHGPLGVGKTALLDAVVEEGRRRGFVVARVAVGTAGPARLAWAQLLRDVGGAPKAARRLLGESGPLDLDTAARALLSTELRLLVVDDIDRAGPEAVEVLSLLATRVAGSSTALVATASTALGIAREIPLGPLSEDDLGSAVGEDRPAVARALWLASSGLPGRARLLAEQLDGLADGTDPVTHLALHVPTQVSFLALDPPLIRLLELAAGREADAGPRARILARLARELLADPLAGARRRALVDEALVLARAAAEPATLDCVLDARLHALWDPAAAEDRLAAASEIVDLARAGGDGAQERSGLFWRFVALVELGRVAEAETALAAMERAVRLAGDAEAMVMVTARHAMLAALRGRFADARRLTDEVAESGRRAGRADTEALVSTLRGMVFMEQGTHEEAASAVGLLLDYARRQPGHLMEATAAGVLAAVGRTAEAAAEMARVLPQVLHGSGPRWVGAVASLTLVVSTTHDREVAGELDAALRPYRGRLVTQGGANFVGPPVSHCLGRLALVLGRRDEAVELFSEAATLAERIGALPLLAHAQAGLADALLSRSGPGDRDAAEELRRRARSIAEQLEMTVLLAALSPAGHRWRLRQEGNDWVLDAGAEHVRLRDGRGLHHLRALLAAPRREVPALDLVAGGPGLVPSTTGPVFDEQARSEYRRRLASLSDDLDDAERAGDPDLTRRLEVERRELLAELRRGTGLGGRSREASPEAERARVNVTRTLRAAIERISEVAPRAGAHLHASIRTGLACRYEPAAGGPAGWEV